MQPHEWLVPIGEHYKELEKEYLSLEPAERAAESGKSPALDAIRLKWRRVVDDVRTAIEENHSAFNVFAKVVLARVY